MNKELIIEIEDIGDSFREDDVFNDSNHIIEDGVYSEDEPPQISHGNSTDAFDKWVILW